MLGGVEIPFDKGLEGHSDADALCHAITDSILGALGMGDIGKHFPDTDQRWKDADSIGILRSVVGMAGTEGYTVAWIDTTVIAEQPKLAGHLESMKKALGRTGIMPASINIKAKTNEGMGFTGRGEGIAVFAVCLLTARGGTDPG